MKKPNLILITIPFVLWLLFFIIIPLGLVIYHSLFINEESELIFSAASYIRITDPIYLKILGRSLWLAFLATLTCFLISYPAALFLTSGSMRGRPIWLILLLVPMWMNFLVRTYSLLTLFENTGVVNNILEALGFSSVTFLYNENAVVLGIVFNMFPYMLFPIYTSISKISRDMLEAGRDLGANDWICLSRIIFPLSVKGVISGVTMVFVPSVTTFAISKLLGGGMVPLIGDVIEQQFRGAGDWNFGSALSAFIMLIVMICMWCVNRWSDGEEVANRLW